MYLKPDFLNIVRKKCEESKHVLEKTPIHTLHYPKIIKSFPNSKNILIVRNPNSIFDSYTNSNISSLPSSRQEVIAEIKEYFKKYKTIEKKSFLVTYKRLSLETQNVLDEIYKYINLSTFEYNNFSTQSKVKLNHVFRKGSFETETFIRELEPEYSYWLKRSQ